MTQGKGIITQGKGAHMAFRVKGIIWLLGLNIYGCQGNLIIWLSGLRVHNIMAVRVNGSYGYQSKRDYIVVRVKGVIWRSG